MTLKLFNEFKVTHITVFLLLALVVPLGAQPQGPSPVEKRKIETLITHVAQLQEAKFVRNGRAYDAATAAVFLRRKWQAKESEVKNASDFIDKVASISDTSGKAYLIRFADGREIKSRDFLLAELKKIDRATVEQL